MKRILLAGAGVLALTAAASAADLTMEPAPMAPVVAPAAFDWTGFYAGVHLGGAWGDFGTDVWNDAFGNAQAAIGGVQIGYNYQINQIVLGVQTDFAYTNLTSGTSIIGGYGANINMDWLGSTTLRAGYAIDTWLPYVKGGVAYGNTQGQLTAYNGAVTSDWSTNKWASGWTLGAGLEKAFTKNVTGFAEYDYYDLGKAVYNYDDVGFGVDVKNTTNVVKVGLNYKF